MEAGGGAAAIRIVAFLLALAAALALCGCAADDEEGGREGGSGAGGIHGTGGGGGEARQVACAGLDYCACTAAEGCRIVGEPCFCPCGAYACSDDCLCACAGGAYLGCAPVDCPIAECPEGSTLETGADGCPLCVPPPPCGALDPCGCIQDERCAILGDGCICECGDFECPGIEPCDCGCGGGTYVGCYDRRCATRTCDADERPALGADGCPICVPRD